MSPDSTIRDCDFVICELLNVVEMQNKFRPVYGHGEGWDKVVGVTLG